MSLLTYCLPLPCGNNTVPLRPNNIVLLYYLAEFSQLGQSSTNTWKLFAGRAIVVKNQIDCRHLNTLPNGKISSIQGPYELLSPIL